MTGSERDHDRGARGGAPDERGEPVGRGDEDAPRGDDHAGLTHIDSHGRARMVDVTAKAVTARRAIARCVVRAAPAAIEAVAKAEDTLAFSKAAAMLGANRAPELIPLCHPLPLDGVDVHVDVGREEIEISTTTDVVARTGVEIEALTACAIAGLTAVMALLPYDPEAVLTTLALWHKSGGRSGTWERPS